MAMVSFNVSSGNDAFVARFYSGVGVAFRFDGYSNDEIHSKFETVLSNAIKMFTADSAISSVRVLCPLGREWTVSKVS